MSSRSNKKKAPVPCRRDEAPNAESFERIVHDYRTKYQEGENKVLRFYALLPSLKKAIETAALAKLPSGKRHPHQYRLRKSTLEEAKGRLLSAEAALRHSKTFDELFHVVKREIGGTWDIGELMIYDTATRLGVHLGLEPEKVYLHSGTRAGASALGLGQGQEAIEVAELPEPLQQLQPHEIEDCLCIYKSDLQRLCGA